MLEGPLDFPLTFLMDDQSEIDEVHGDTDLAVAIDRPLSYVPRLPLIHARTWRVSDA